MRLGWEGAPKGVGLVHVAPGDTGVQVLTLPLPDCDLPWSPSPHRKKHPKRRAQSRSLVPRKQRRMGEDMASLFLAGKTQPW